MFSTQGNNSNMTVMSFSGLVCCEWACRCALDEHSGLEGGNENVSSVCGSTRKERGKFCPRNGEGKGTENQATSVIPPWVTSKRAPSKWVSCVLFWSPHFETDVTEHEKMGKGASRGLEIARQGHTRTCLVEGRKIWLAEDCCHSQPAKQEAPRSSINEVAGNPGIPLERRPRNSTPRDMLECGEWVWILLVRWLWSNSSKQGLWLCCILQKLMCFCLTLLVYNTSITATL